MSFFSSLKSEIGAFLTPSNKAIITGQIAAANLVLPDAAGIVKHGWVVSALTEILKVPEAIIHALVKIMHDELSAQTPDVLKPLLDTVTAAAQSAVTDLGTKASDAITQKLEPIPPPVAPTVIILEPVAPRPGLVPADPTQPAPVVSAPFFAKPTSLLETDVPFRVARSPSDDPPTPIVSVPTPATVVPPDPPMVNVAGLAFAPLVPSFSPASSPATTPSQDSGNASSPQAPTPPAPASPPTTASPSFWPAVPPPPTSWPPASGSA